MIQKSKLGLKFFSPAFSTPCLSSGPVNRSDAWHITVALPAQKGVLADLDPPRIGPPGPNPLADMDPPVQIR